MERALLFPLRFPRATILVILALTAWLGSHAFHIEFDPSIDSLLPRNDPERLYYESVKETFGSDEAAVVAIFADDVFAPPTVAKIDRMSRELQQIGGVREVLSLTTVQGVSVDEFGAIEVGRLMKRVPATREESEELKRDILENPLYAAHLLSPDDRATGVLVLFENLSDEEYAAHDIESKLRAVVGTFGGPETYAVTGIHSLKAAAGRLMKQDLTRFLPLSILVVMLILAVAFRTIRGVVLPTTAVLIGLSWTMGLMVLAGARINLATLVLPPLLVALGIAYAVHIIARYYLRLGHDARSPEALQAAVCETALPVALAGLTTILGFAILAFSSIQAVHDFGIFALIGISVIMLVADAFVPAALVLFPEPRRGRGRYDHNHWVSRFLAWCGRVAVEHRWRVLAVAAAICVIAGFGVARLHVETDYLTFIDPNHPIRIEAQRVTDSLGGAQPIYFVVDGDAKDSVRQLPALAALRDLQAFIDEQPEVDKTLSLVDYLAVVRGALNPDASPGLPEGQGEVSQLLVFVGPKDLRPVANADFSRANIIVGTGVSSSAEVRRLVERVEEYAATRFPPNLSVRASGTIAVLNRSADVLAEGQVSGLCWVAGSLLVIMSIWLLSLRAGLAALIPNLVPILVMFGLMGWGGITLSVSTSLVAVIGLVIAVADTIHYLTAFNSHLRETGDEEAAIAHVGREVGLPIVFTTVVLTAGFSVVCLSNFTPIRQFGLLAGSTMVLALFADLLILPALVRSAHLVTAWDLLSTKLGTVPPEQMPLFRGLRAFQAKIVVLMGKVRQAPRGTYITREGELKDELYVLLTGSADVRRAGSDAVIRHLHAGDVIGEMGIVRHQPRSADVIVATPAEYLVLDAACMCRIQRRHPRIAAAVFRNLTRILSDRLENTTNELVRLAEEESAAREALPA